ncbi:MAG: glycosyltransferase family 39 protein [Gammaproteobacteria bacterium]|nr:glycosyltransferase family 39 protein [Gammaproteobacteria bacterium]
MTARSKTLLTILVFAVVVRVAILGAYPLHDTTEARYAEIARLMITTGDWVTPHIAEGVPFWGKPPLSMWLTAASFEFLGQHEFAARLPSFLLVVGTLFLVFRLGDRLYSRETGIAAAAIMLSCAIAFIAAGAVMTDASLLFATTLALAGFLMTVEGFGPGWRYLVFVGLGIGLLAKGPVAVVLTGMPIAIWSLSERPGWLSLRRIPWLSGTLLSLVIAAPWYVLAELKTPGFLEYFLLGEHWLRFVQAGWEGDMYGSAHARPRGTIWLFGFAALLPWSIVALYALLAKLRTRTLLTATDARSRFLLWWTLSPLLFFSFAGNILPAYVLPGVPAFALLLAVWIVRRRATILHAGWVTPVLTLAVAILLSVGAIPGKTQKDLLRDFVDVAPGQTLFYFPRKPYSADFYSGGQSRLLPTSKDLVTYLAEPGRGFVAIRRNSLERLPAGVSACLAVNASYSSYILFEKDPLGCPAKLEIARD